jgi:hypothetical protein
MRGQAAQRKKERKHFFSEEKKQKTFISLSSSIQQPLAHKVEDRG